MRVKLQPRRKQQRAVRASSAAAQAGASEYVGSSGPFPYTASIK